MNDPAEQAAIDVEAMAAIDFEPLKDLPSTWQPPTNLQWTELANPHLISVRLAWLTLQKSKGELVDMASELGDETLMDLVAQPMLLIVVRVLDGCMRFAT